MQTEMKRLREAWKSGDPVRALKIAAGMGSLGGYEDPITRAWAAYRNPGFYKATGRNPLTMVRTGLLALRKLFSLP